MNTWTFVVLLCGLLAVQAVSLIAIGWWLLKRIEIREAVPPEAYAQAPQQIGRFKNTHLWHCVSGIFAAGIVLEWMKQSAFVGPLQITALGLGALLLVWRIAWSFNVLRRQKELDPRLVRLARHDIYTMAVLLLIPACAFDVWAVRTISRMFH